MDPGANMDSLGDYTELHCSDRCLRFYINLLRMSFTEASYRGSCTQVAQCTLRLGSYATCKEGSCDCQVNHHYSEPDGQCIADVGEYRNREYQN